MGRGRGPLGAEPEVWGDSEVFSNWHSPARGGMVDYTSSRITHEVHPIGLRPRIPLASLPHVGLFALALPPSPGRFRDGFVGATRPTFTRAVAESDSERIGSERTTRLVAHVRATSRGHKELSLPTMTNEEALITSGFEEMGLRDTTLAALGRMGLVTPSPIQANLVPPAVAGRDCLGNAPTGTGKTCAFLIPILESIDDRE